MFVPPIPFFSCPYPFVDFHRVLKPFQHFSGPHPFVKRCAPHPFVNFRRPLLSLFFCWPYSFVDVRVPQPFQILLGPTSLLSVVVLILGYPQLLILMSSKNEHETLSNEQ